MVTSSASELLTLWEQCLPLAPIGRAVAMLALTNPDATHDAVAMMPLGTRDTQLLRLRARTFGTRLTGIVPCPGCGESVELGIEASELLAAAPGPAQHHSGDLTIDHGGFHVTFRLPTSADIASLTESQSSEELDRVLLSRCIRWAEHDGSPVAAAELPVAVIDAIADTMAANDPMAKIEFACVCPACGHAWLALLDIAGFVWAEVDDLARRLLQEIHVLASGYGWREADILALTATRRQVYLEMVAG